MKVMQMGNIELEREAIEERALNVETRTREPNNNSTSLASNSATDKTDHDAADATDQQPDDATSGKSLKRTASEKPTSVAGGTTADTKTSVEARGKRKDKNVARKETGKDDEEVTNLNISDLEGMSRILAGNVRNAGFCFTQKTIPCHRCNGSMRLCMRRVKYKSIVKNYPTYRCMQKQCQTFCSPRTLTRRLCNVAYDKMCNREPREQMSTHAQKQLVAAFDTCFVASEDGSKKVYSAEKAKQEQDKLALRAVNETFVLLNTMLISGRTAISHQLRTAIEGLSAILPHFISELSGLGKSTPICKDHEFLTPPSANSPDEVRWNKTSTQVEPMECDVNTERLPRLSHVAAMNERSNPMNDLSTTDTLNSSDFSKPPPALPKSNPYPWINVSKCSDSFKVTVLQDKIHQLVDVRTIGMPPDNSFAAAYTPSIDLLCNKSMSGDGGLGSDAQRSASMMVPCAVSGCMMPNYVNACFMPTPNQSTAVLVHNPTNDLVHSDANACNAPQQCGGGACGMQKPLNGFIPAFPRAYFEPNYAGGAIGMLNPTTNVCAMPLAGTPGMTANSTDLYRVPNRFVVCDAPPTTTSCASDVSGPSGVNVFPISFGACTMPNLCGANFQPPSSTCCTTPIPACPVTSSNGSTRAADGSDNSVDDSTVREVFKAMVL